MTGEPESGGEFVRSLQRGLAVIRAFDADHQGMTLTEVAGRAGLTRAAARRFLLTLVELRYVSFHDGRYWLLPRVLELGYAYLSSLSLGEVARLHLESFVAEVNESSSISVLDDLDIVYVVRAPVRRVISIGLSVGSRLPAYATSMGRVLLAGLDDADLEERLARLEITPLTPWTVRDVDALRSIILEVREQGYALVEEEFEEGLRSVAVPLRDASGTVIAAVNTSVHSSRGTVETLRRDVLPLLLDTVQAIEVDLRSKGGVGTFIHG